MPRALVTGGTGFVARALIASLVRDGWVVTATRRDSLKDADLDVAWITLGGVRDVRRAIDDAAPDVTFHLAAHQARSRTPEDVEAFLAANIGLGAHLLDALVGSGAVVVNAMSYFQYRNGAPQAHSLYAATKQAYAVLADYYRQCEGLDIRDVVLYDNYGPSDERTKLVPLLLSAAVTGSRVTIGPLAQPLNLLHVDDVASGLIAAARPGSASSVTVRAASSVTVGEVVATVEAAAGHPIEVVVDDTREVSDLTLSAGNWPIPSGWVERWSLNAGIRQAYGAATAG